MKGVKICETPKGSLGVLYIVIKYIFEGKKKSDHPLYQLGEWVTLCDAQASSWDQAYSKCKKIFFKLFYVQSFTTNSNQGYGYICTKFNN